MVNKEVKKMKTEEMNKEYLEAQAEKAAALAASSRIAELSRRESARLRNQPTGAWAAASATAAQQRGAPARSSSAFG